MSTEGIPGIRQRATQYVARVLEHPGRDEIDPALVARVRDAVAAVEAAAEAPVRVGFGGGFKTGKSVLVGFLLGDAGLLPVADQAATGAIIEVRPVVAQVPATTPAPDATVHYLDRATVDLYRDELVKVLRAEAAPFHLPGPEGLSWSQLSAWCEKVLWPRPELRPRVWELIDLRDAVCGLPHLVGSPPATVPWPVARRHLLMIGRGAGFRPPVPHWPVPGPIPAARLQDPATLETSRRLVERVEITVTVPQRYWPLEKRAGEHVVLCDTPGRGADQAQIRDELLLRRVMSELDAFVVVMEPLHPDAAVVTELQREFAAASGQKRAIVVVNKFDQYPAAAPELESRVGVVTDDDIRHAPALGGLAAAWATATGGDELAGNDVVFASAVTAWALGPADAPPPVPPPAGESLDHWRQTKIRRARAWGALGDRAERRGIAGPLSDFGIDGGIRRLRELLTGHAVRVGLTRKEKRLRDLQVELDAALEPAEAALRSWYERRRDDAEQHRDTLRAEVCWAARNQLLDTLKRCDLDVFRRDYRLENGLTGPEEVTRRALRRVSNWRLWPRVWEAVDQQQVRSNPRGLPVLGDELREDFAQARAAACQDGREVADLLVLTWLARRKRELAGLTDAFRAAIDPVRDRLVPTFDEHREQLAKAVTVGWLKARLDSADQPDSTGQARDPFPLRPEYRLAWHPEPGPGTDRHQVNIARLQYTLSNAVVRAGLEAWASRLRERTAVLREALEQLQEAWFHPDSWEQFVHAAYPPQLRDALPGESTKPFSLLSELDEPERDRI